VTVAPVRPNQAARVAESGSDSPAGVLRLLSGVQLQPWEQFRRLTALARQPLLDAFYEKLKLLREERIEERCGSSQRRLPVDGFSAMSQDYLLVYVNQAPVLPWSHFQNRRWISMPSSSRIGPLTSILECMRWKVSQLETYQGALCSSASEAPETP